MTLWLLAVAGSAFVLTQSSITEGMREWLAASSRQANMTSGLRATYEERRKQHPELPRVRAVLPTRAWAAASSPLAKIVSCPMCSGFWLGLLWGVFLLPLSVPATVDPGAWHWFPGAIRILANGFGGSIVSALAVAIWLALGEAYAALGLYRFLHSPGGPSDGKVRIPKHMKPAFANHTPQLYVCACGETVTAGSAHVMGPRCEPPEA